MTGDAATERSQGAPNPDDPLAQHLAETQAELRALAATALREWRNVSSTQTTSLIQDAFLRLAGRGIRFNDRAHFLRTAACAMRCILVDRARRAGAEKRGGERLGIPLEDGIAVVPDGPDLVVIDDALTRLRAFDERKCQLVELRFFAGLPMDAAYALGVSLATAKREWAVARAWLAREIGDPG